MPDTSAPRVSAPRVRLSAQLPPTARHDEEGHEALRDLFDRFELTTTEAGVEVRPVLSAGTTARILDGLQEWPNGLRYDGRDVVTDPETGALVCFADDGDVPGEPVEDAELAPRPAPKITAKPGQTPPLRAIQVPSAKLADSVQ